ncbi:hypothetical protein F5I97DRAFT_1803117 [Phlebopus sp. FC_14]|nr:hypothetical protein F5I97DRAFT_1803117 [Phlebopus sp. FC_14]
MADIHELNDQPVVATLATMSSPPPADSGPVPLSFPAILRNPKLPDRYAHLRITSNDGTDAHQSQVKKSKKDRSDHDGKRWVRRWENARFTHNPHITLPTSRDLTHPLPHAAPTFPTPLPPFLPRTVPIPPASTPAPDPATASAGLFSLSLRGARRTLRARPAAAPLVQAIEAHLLDWLDGATWLDPDDRIGVFNFPGNPVSGRDDIREVGREPDRLVWAVRLGVGVPVGTADGGFERYVVHCVARWYGVISFSKETGGHRLTYLLRPNITRPDPQSALALDTPPATDASDFHPSDHDDATPSDFTTTDASDLSDVDSITGYIPSTDDKDNDIRLSEIAESRPSSPAAWSVIGGSDFEVDSVNNDVDDYLDRGFAASMESLSLSTYLEDTHTTPPARPSIPTPSRLRTLYPRSASSPSPARRSPRLHTSRKRRGKSTKNRLGMKGGTGTKDKGKFYDYLFG